MVVKDLVDGLDSPRRNSMDNFETSWASLDSELIVPGVLLGLGSPDSSCSTL